jgi:hypothetical protein
VDSRDRVERPVTSIDDAKKSTPDFDQKNHPEHN